MPTVFAVPPNEVSAGLTGEGQKSLPSKFLYDDIGSALFEVISLLPEYGLTRADERLLRAHASAIAAQFAVPVMVAELGSGSGRKTRWILQALARQQSTLYYPIEISAAALARCHQELSDVESLTISDVEQEYLEGLSIVSGKRPRGHALLVLFLGSSIGNLEHVQALEFLRQVRGMLRPGDALLLGTDLEKSVPQLLAAYDDPLGVTRSFNLNLLARLNREFDADFNPEHFEHEVRFNYTTRSIEMYLRSRRQQTVTLQKLALAVEFESGERILTEISHKYSVEEVVHLAENAGFRCREQFIDREWPFAESFLRAA